MDATEIFVELSGKENYEYWSACMENYLKGKDLWDVVEGTAQREENENEWEKKNAMALHAILISCGRGQFSKISSNATDSAQIVWKNLIEEYKDFGKDAWGKVKLKLPVITEPSFMEGNPVYKSLSKAVEEGKWMGMKPLLDQIILKFPVDATLIRGIVLHRAILGEHIKIVEELLKEMSENDVTIRDDNGYTALSIVAHIGNTEIARALVGKNRKLVSEFKTASGRIPIAISSMYGHEKMTRYLYSRTPLDMLSPHNDKDNRKNGLTVLYNCITSGTMLDIALDLLQNWPELVVPDNQERSPLHALVETPFAFPSGTPLAFWQKLIYYCVPVPRYRTSRRKPGGDIESNLDEPKTELAESYWSFVRFLVPTKIYEARVRHRHAEDILHLICEQMLKLDGSQLDLEKIGVQKALFKAIRNGIEEVVVEVLKYLPHMFWCKDDQLRSLLAYAVVKRQQRIFNFLNKDKRKLLLTRYYKEGDNNLLHYAAILPSFSQSPDGQVSGAALQMQKEMHWFQEVEKIVQPKYRNKTNKDGKTPGALFTEQHKNLVQEGEKWVKDTATSCTVVAALISTIMFAVAFTVPGAYGDNGVPKLVHLNSFIVFMISDALSLFSSSTSVLVFLGILTTRYREVDFHRAVPTKLMIGLSSLFFSIATMMITFSTTIVIMLHDKWPWISYPIICLATVPVLLYALFQFPLLVEIFKSTYQIGLFEFPLLVQIFKIGLSKAYATRQRMIRKPE